MSKGPEKLHVVNPGFDRHGLDSPNGPEQPIHVFLSPTPQGKMEDSVWPSLRWWESPLQAEAGIKALGTRPFLHLMKDGGESANVLARQLYDDALDPEDETKVKAAAQFIAVHMRQGRELYTAAGGAGVTDLSTPLLYYYGALALAKAAVAAVFGVWNQSGERHGLDYDRVNRPTSDHPTGVDWPTVVIWQQSGMFRRLYRTARWDEVWQRWGKLGLPASPKFHVLECIRYPGSEWSPLRPTGFARPDFPPPQDYRDKQHPREKTLLAYQPDGDLFMHLSTPPTSPVFQLPRVVVHFMLLHYFSTLARYHAGAWQELLGGATEPEGHVFRVAFLDRAGRFLREIRAMLPLPYDSTTPAPNAPPLPTPLPANWHDYWYTWPEEPLVHPAS